MVFVPAKDSALSKRFYLALGSELVDDGEDYAEFRWGDDRFIVRDQYQAQWAEHFGVHLIVKDAAAFARRASELVASGDFPGVRVEGPREEPWGYRVTYVWDPSGVSLRFSEPMKRPKSADTTHAVSWRTIGASVHTSVDLDCKGSPASFVVADGDGTFGRASVQGMTEPAPVPVEKCPAGTAMEFHMIGGTMVRTFHDRLDQVFIKTVSGLACIFEDGRVTSEGEAKIIGGTGRFEGATGQLTTRTLPQTVSFPTWRGEFNNIMNVTEGSITLRDAPTSGPSDAPGVSP